MTKQHIAQVLFEMKRTGECIAKIEGELVTADELLTQFYSRPVSEEEGQRFITHDLKHA